MKIALYLFDSFIVWVQHNARLVVHEIDLFLGTALVLFGVLGFDSDKYCDGNTADYLSCTRPSTYYYFDSLDIALIVIGTFLVILWFLKRSRMHSKRGE